MIDVVASSLLTDGATTPAEVTTRSPPTGRLGRRGDQRGGCAHDRVPDLRPRGRGRGRAPGGLVVSPDGDASRGPSTPAPGGRSSPADVAGAEEGSTRSSRPAPRPAGRTRRLRLRHRGGRLPERRHRRRDHFLADGSAPVRSPASSRPSRIAGHRDGRRTSPSSDAERLVLGGRRREARTGALLWETCDYQLGAFSPDGASWWASPPDA